MRVVLVFLCCVQSLFGYLDPSTGSLLLSSVVAVFVSAVFMLKSAFYKVYGLISHLYGGGGLKANKNHGLVFYSEGRQYYDVFAPILETLDSWDYPYIFLTSDSADPALTHHKQSKFIGTGNRAYAYLNGLSADVVVMTTPGLDVLQIKRARGVGHYCHIVHSLASPNYRVFGLDYYDSVLVNSVMQEEFIRRVERAHGVKRKEIFITGSTYCDALCARKERIVAQEGQEIFASREGRKVVLLSPSWGKEGLLSKFGMRLIEAVLSAGHLLIIRPHPQSLISESLLIEDLRARTEGMEAVRWDIGTPNVHAMSQSDVMISDFSGIIFDYLCLYEKPVLIIDFDFDHAGYDSADIGELWEFGIFGEIGKRVREEDFGRLGEIIAKLTDGGGNQEAISRVRELLWTHARESGVQSARAILGLREKVLGERLGRLKGYSDEILKIREVLA